MSLLEILPVRTREALAEFIDLPFALYREDPLWVPPIRAGIKRLLDPRRHPFWQNARRELYLARRNRTPVGRIAAIIDDRNNRHHNESICAWGFFECRHDPEAAAALFAAAEDWARDNGMTALRGPLNPSLNYEAGLLIHGFDQPPVLGFTYNPPHYHGLVVGCGYRKEKDLLAYRFPAGYRPPDWVMSAAAKAVARGEITIRPPDFKRFDREVHLLRQVYNECWSDNWCHVPMTEAEMRESVREMLPVVDPELAFFVCHGDEIIGVNLILPDVNPFLRRLDGRGGLRALYLKKRYFSRDVTGLRGYILGLRKPYRRTGAPLLAVFDRVFKVLSSGRWDYIEMGWNLEDNEDINRIYEDGGARPSRRFRLYRKNLAPRA